MAVKKYENGAFIRCRKELNSKLVYCVDANTNEPFGRTSGEYDLTMFSYPDKSFHGAFNSETVMIHGFCFDEIESDGRRTLTCEQEKQKADFLYEEDKKMSKDVIKYY